MYSTSPPFGGAARLLPFGGAARLLLVLSIKNVENNTFLIEIATLSGNVLEYFRTVPTVLSFKF